MIDGVKILCVGTDWELWQDHNDLDFWAYVNTNTGEVPTQTKVASLNGLMFKLCPYQNDNGKFHPLIKGSLHNFWNEGKGNADNYSLSDIQKTVDILKDKFGVVPEKAVLQNLEFGLNIHLPITAKEFISNIISMPDKAFAAMDIKRPSMGRVCHRTEYGLKIYDKCYQQNGERNKKILRIELTAKKSRFLDKFNINVLSDLTNTDNLAKMGAYLLRTFSDLIYYDGSINEKLLYKRELLKLKDFCSAYYWERLDRKKRYKKRLQYDKMMLGYSANNVKKNVLNDMRNLWVKLMLVENQKGDNFTNLENTIGADKRGTISQLGLRGKTSPFENQKKEDNLINTNTHKSKIHNEKSTPNCEENKTQSPGQKCCTCGRDISHQKKGSKYCNEKEFGRKCRDAGYNRLRKARRQANRKLEEINLAVVIEGPPTDLNLIIFFNDGFSIELMANVAPFSLPRPYRSVIRVSVIRENSIFILTTRRAKKLIKWILAAPDG